MFSNVLRKLIILYLKRDICHNLLKPLLEPEGGIEPTVCLITSKIHGHYGIPAKLLFDIY